ncbi:uncharacterized protein LOC118645710 [Monomorium pharaonis]|uniref:uncharacterized protein LOC118645710 n=1 Tax=Monomorium pharaonis TaxID=307658 RepID=UPI0017463461|nr:uncharacterized protein LOC118645710 [Monomorium pharaonis]
MFLMETWLDGKDWEKVRNRLPEGYEWGVQKAGRKNKKGRAIGGLRIVGVRTGLRKAGTKIEEIGIGIMSVRVRLDSEEWRIVGVYVRDEEKEIAMQRVRQIVEIKEEGTRVVMGGDFNARTGCEGGWRDEIEREEEEEQGRRQSKDKKMDKGGRNLLELLGECGWEIFNGCVLGNEEGEFTYVGGRGCSVIDYILGEKKTKDRIEKMRVVDKVDSDHMPVKLVVGNGAREREQRVRNRGIRGIWDEESKKRFREELDKGIEEIGGRLNEEWDDMEGKIIEAVGRIEAERRKRKKNSKG